MSSWKRWIVVFLALVATASPSQRIIDSKLGYTITLPDHWVMEIGDSAEHQFIDTSLTQRSLIALKRYDISKDTLYTYQQEWTRANFIAYVLSIESDPLCALMYYDTLTAWQNDTLWAADAYTHFFPYDTTIGAYAEYVRFTELGRFGYEIYAIGELADMDSNLNFYKGIIDSIVLHTRDVAVLRPYIAGQTHRSPLSRPFYTFDLLGRRMDNKLVRNKTFQVIFTRQGKSFIRK